MRLFLSRFPAWQLPGGLLFALLCAAMALAGPKYFRNGATFRPVTTTADSGPGSLRAAIEASGDGDTIYFDSALNGQTINLTSGELAINASITITGPGPNLLTVSRDEQAPPFRIFHLLPGHKDTIQGLTVRGGTGHGGGIRNDNSTLRVNNCIIRDNYSPNSGFGGGIYNDGSGGSATLTIIDCSITSNVVSDAGGGIYNDASNGGSATVSMWNSSVTNNGASFFMLPFGGGNGGGIYNSGSGASVTLTNCIVSNNYVGVPDPFPVGNGGGIYNDGTLTIITSTINSNQCWVEGGGVYNGGTLTIISSTVSGNQARGTHDGKGWGYGGGILNNGALTITNSTLSNNHATHSGGGMDGGGTITNSTISGNTANQGDGGGIFVTGVLEIGNTILNAGTSGANIFNNGGTATSNGYNLSSDDGGGFLNATGDQINTDPMLSPLQHNGGPTFTHEPLNGSPAIGAGDPDFTPPPFEDQRGYLRVINGRIDIGSLEVQPVPTPSPPSTPTPTPCGVIVFLSEDFDGLTPPALPPGWVSTFTPGPANCTPAGTCALGTNWATSTTAPHSPPHCVFHNAPGCVTDSTLDTLSFNGGLTNGTFLFFRHSYDLEDGLDGAVLEISIKGGPFVDFVAAGGGNLGYNGTISSGSFSPIAGRAAWTGNSGGYVQAFAQMPAGARGENVRLRFRLATDCSGAGTGWRIDTITISDNIGCQTPTVTPPPPSATPTATSPPPTATPIPTPCGVTFSENFDGVTAPALPGGWTTAANGSGVPWVTSTTFPTSGPNDAFASPAFNIGNTELVTPVIAAPAGGILSFQNLFNLQGGPPPSTVGYDGMVLEISINSGAYADIIAAGGSFVTGGYTHTITNVSGSPIAGRMAWSGVSAASTVAPAYITTTLNLPATANGQNIQLKWRLATDGNPNTGLPAPGVRIDSIILTPTGCATPTPSPTPTATASATPARPLNLSTRMLVQPGDEVGIGGFIITGGAPKQVLLRGIGPSLAQFGVPNVLADPVMELHGPAGFTTIVNDNWRDTQEAEIQATGIPPISNLESAIMVTLDPGAYTAIVKGKNDSSGVGLVEVYDLGPAASKLANISTRGFVSTGANVMIGGFILGGGDNTHVLIRGRGPSLAGFGISPVLADPTLELRDSNGALLALNDNCGKITVPPFDPAESCIDISLPAGAFTAILAGKNGGTGIGLLEIYNLN